MNDDFTPQELALIKRLRNAPQRGLSAEAKEAIGEQILSQVGAPPMPVPRPGLRRFYVPAMVAAAVIAISLGGLVLRQYPTPPPLPTTGVTTPLPSSTLPSATVASTASPAPSQAVAVSLDGVVQAINANVITVNDTPVTLAANDPILNTVHVGDTVHISGSIDPTGKLVASDVQTATAAVDGVVQAVNNNVVTINGIQVQLPTNYPGLSSIKVGAFLSVSGYFRSNGTTVLLMVIDVTVVPTLQVPTLEKCRTAQPAMGMAPPDAMGMGDPGMGMGMGMGEPGMGTDGCN